MPNDRPKLRTATEARRRLGEHPPRVARPADRLTDVTPGQPPYRLLWFRIAAGAPGEPPDERYYADEVRPKDAGTDGRLEWEAVPGGLAQAVMHNMAEAAAHTHLLSTDMIVHAEERLDRSAPPAFLYLADVPVAATERLARIVSYDGTSYTVQPVVYGAGGMANDGSPVSGVVNLGELWPDEKGYLAGPTGYDRIVSLVSTPAGWTIILHPPRMV
jgi:hypothetical protein